MGSKSEINNYRGNTDQASLAVDFVSVNLTQCKCPSTLSCKNHVSLNVFKEEISVFVRKLPLPCTASWQAVYGTAKQWGSFCSRGRMWHDPERAYRSTIKCLHTCPTHPPTHFFSFFLIKGMFLQWISVTIGKISFPVWLHLNFCINNR